MKVKTFGPGLTPGSKCYLGIDQSYSGFATTYLAEDNSYVTIVRKFEGVGISRLAEVYKTLNMEIDHLFDEYQCTVEDAAIEGYAFGSQMANMAGELGAITKLALYNRFDNNAKYPLIVPPTNLKKYVAGKGTGVAKSQMLLHVFKNWGAEFSDDNAADSFGLAHLVAKKYKKAVEKEVYEKLQDPKFREG